MKSSRRKLAAELAGMIGVLTAASVAQDKMAAPATTSPVQPVEKLVSKTYPFGAMEVKTNAAGNKGRALFTGALHNGFVVNSHITELPPGGTPHPPHKHVHEEMMLLRYGTIETTVNGKTTKLEAGSVSFIASNEEHSLRNVGSDQALYFVVEFRGNGA